MNLRPLLSSFVQETKRKRTPNILFLLFFFTLSTPVTWALDYANNPVSATYAQTWDYTPTLTGLYTFETEIQNPTGDTVLYVKGGNVSVFNDDCHMDINNVCPSVGQNSIRRSKLKVQLAAGTTYKIIVVAFVTFGEIASRVRFHGTAHLKATNHSIWVETIFGGHFAYTYLMTNMPFGGDMINVQDNEPNLHLYASTSGRPKAIQTWQPILLMGVKCDRSMNGLSTGYTGVGWHSALSTVGSCGIYVASPHVFSLIYGYDLPETVLNVMLNDAFHPDSDHDQDYLGIRLEQSLGTCDRDSQVLVARPQNPPDIRCGDTVTNPNNQQVRRIYNFQDSDCDGIPDLHEVYGISAYFGGSVQLLDLSALGASPSRKDLFLEIDESNGGVPLNGWPAVIRSLHQSLKDAPSGDVVNARPDISGIRVHADIGIAPENTEDDNLQIYNDWGGHQFFSAPNPLPVGHPSVGQEPHKITEQIGRAMMAELRQGVFRYIHAVRDPTILGCEATAPVGRWHINLRYGSNETDAAVCQRKLLKAIGHSMGLTEFGHLRWGSAPGNPHYRSVMNPVARQVNQFSTVPPNHQVTGNAPNFTPLSPRDATKHDPLGSDIDHSFLANEPFQLPYSFTPTPLPGNTHKNTVEWGFESAFFRLTHPVTLSQIRTDFALVNKQDLQVVSGESTTPTLLLVEKKSPLETIIGRPDSRMYLFYTHQESGQNKVFYRFAKTGVNIVVDLSAPSPRPNQISCPGGDKILRMGNNLVEEPANECTVWSPPIPIIGTEGAKSVTAVFLREIGNDLIEQFLIAYIDANNRLMFRRSTFVNFDNTAQNGLPPGHVAWDETPGGWKSVDNNVIGEPHLLLTGLAQSPPSGGYEAVNFQNYHLSESVELFYRRTDKIFRQLSLVRNTPADWTWTASGGFIVTDQATGSPLTGEIDATPLWWWGATTNQTELCAAFPDTNHNGKGYKVHFYCKDGNAWIDRTLHAFGGESPDIRTNRKVGLTTRTARFGGLNEAGSPIFFGSNSNNVVGSHLWLVVQNNTDAPLLYLSGATFNRPSNTNAPLFKNTSFPYGYIGTMLAGQSGVFLLDHPQLITMRAATILPSETGPMLTFLPFADGTYDAVFTTDSDFKVMARGLCLGTKSGDRDPLVAGNPEAACGTIAQSVWGY